MKLHTLAATAVLTVGLAASAAAQNELLTLPQAPAPAATPAPSSNTAPLPMPAYHGERLPGMHGYPKSSLDIALGWGAPTGGFGLSYTHMVGSSWDASVGVGLGIGLKTAVGTRFFVLPDRNWSPYFGLGVSHTGRIDDVEFSYTNTVNGVTTTEEGKYTQHGTGVLHLRTGVRWQPKRVGLIGSVGYGVRFTGNPIEYAPGYYPSHDYREIAQLFSPGGLEISLGMSIGLSRR